ncbi:MAG: hypothetical protein HFI75_10735 [Lachnospiraceae bacterium]|nr:hypothetical protein [Lachnospiraceae bacterium]
MKNREIRSIIDQELKDIQLSNRLKDQIRSRAAARRPCRLWKGIAASIAVVMLGGSMVYGGYYILNSVQVNEETLPELDAMEAVQIRPLQTTPDQYGMLQKDFRDYRSVKEELGIRLLDSSLCGNHPYMRCRVRTDGTDFAIVTVENFIIGDIEQISFIEEEQRYSYERGIEYASPITLTADLILSELQLEQGWQTDYLGMYRFVEAYTSRQGYRVNVVEDTIHGKQPYNYVSQKIVVFVADGVRYTLKGRVSLETIKEIVDTMQ